MTLQHFSDPSIQCPHCQGMIKLTESLALPLLEEERQKSRLQIQSMQEKMQSTEENILLQQKKIEEERSQLLEKKAQQEKEAAHQLILLQQKENQQQKEFEAERLKLHQNYENHLAKNLTEKLEQAKQDIIQEEKKKAAELYALDLKKQAQMIEHLENLKAKNELELEKAQAAELQVLKKEEELLKKEQRLELELQQRVLENSQKAHVELEKQLQEKYERQNQMLEQQREEKFKLEQSQKDLMISGLQSKIEELNKKAQQGSQQLQGEAFEVELENTLRERFYQDQIEAVAKGVNGADLLQTVYDSQQKAAGTIIWELKNTKTWRPEWLSKLRQDQRQASADIAVLLSYSLPFKSESFEMIDGVWVAHPRFAVPLAMLLRDGLLQVQKAQYTQQGLQQKSELVYAYLNSPAFRLRLEAIVEAFTTMKEDLDKEKKVILKQWEKRNKQIERVIESTIGMYGDLQGIAGRDIQNIPALEFDDFDELDDMNELDDVAGHLEGKENKKISKKIIHQAHQAPLAIALNAEQES